MGLQEMIAANAAAANVPVAGAVPVAAVVPAAAVPVAAALPVVAAAAPLAVAGAAAPAPLGGGTMLESMMNAMATATVGSQRNDFPLGTGISLLKSGKFFITEDGKWKIASFSFLCLKGIVDANAIACGSPGYSGPIPGETYEVALFQDYSPKKQKGTMGANLSAVQACMGWSKEKMKQFQSTPEGLQTLTQLWAGLLCCDMLANATNQPCIFANQVVIQISTKSRMYEQKDKVTKQPLYDKDGNKAMGTSINTYWDKKVPLADLVTMIPEAEIVAAFGTAEAFNAAHQNETALAAAFG